MKSQTRKEILEVLAQLGGRFPDLRFGQLVVNVCNAVLPPGSDSLWDVEDEDFLGTAQQFLAELQKRDAPETVPTSQR